MRVKLGTVVDGKVTHPHNLPVPDGTRVMILAPEPGDEKIEIPSPSDQMVLLDAIDQLRRGVPVDLVEDENEPGDIDGQILLDDLRARNLG